jgi:low temperature requirement protein LtrA
MESNLAGINRPVEIAGHKVTSLELFFDLVFVLAFTQVTAKLSLDQTWEGLGRALLVLAVLWWAWGGYAWLTNAFDPESKLMRIPIFVAMAALLVAALAVPEAFGANAAMFAWAYFAVRMIHISLYLYAARGNSEVFNAFLRLTPAMFAAPVILLISLFFDGEVQAAVWILAIAVDYSGPYLLGGEGWEIASEHFAERFGLIVIIALGESIVSIGVGATGLPLDLKTVGAAIVGIGLVSALWWMYFDVVALVAMRKLGEAVGVTRSRLARDTYSVLHYFLIAGIILLALAIKKTIAHPEEHLKEIPAVALCAGLAMFTLTMSAIKRRDVGSWNWQRLFVGALMLALIPAAEKLPALATLSITLGIYVLLILFETIRFSETRAAIRAQRD